MGGSRTTGEREALAGNLNYGSRNKASGNKAIAREMETVQLPWVKEKRSLLKDKMAS